MPQQVLDEAGGVAGVLHQACGDVRGVLAAGQHVEVHVEADPDRPCAVPQQPVDLGGLGPGGPVLAVVQADPAQPGVDLRPQPHQGPADGALRGGEGGFVAALPVHPLGDVLAAAAGALGDVGHADQVGVQAQDPHRGSECPGTRHHGPGGGDRIRSAARDRHAVHPVGAGQYGVQFVGEGADGGVVVEADPVHNEDELVVGQRVPFPEGGRDWWGRAGARPPSSLAPLLTNVNAAGRGGCPTPPVRERASGRRGAAGSAAPP